MSRQNDLRSVIRESRLGTGVPSFLLGARFGWHLSQGLMTGIGCLGGGAIVKRGLNAHGAAATAASIWNTAAVGAAVADGLYEIALLLSAANLAVLHWLGPIKEQVGESGGS
jgi:putative Mg2+ transporter-C (MgtC) family protein